MTRAQQPEALRLADKLEDVADMAIKRIKELEAQLSATPAAQEGWCDGCNPDNCVGCGPAAPAQMQPKRGNSHD